MYAGAAVLRNFRWLDGELQQSFLGDGCGGNAFPMWNQLNFALSEHDVGGGDLFNAPEPIIEEPILELDPITTAICVMSSGEDFIAAEAMKVADIESIQNEHLLSEVFYGCKKELLEKSAFEASSSELLGAKLPAVHEGDDTGHEQDRLVTEGPVQKSESSVCPTSIELIHHCTVEPNCDEFQEVELEDAYGIRRAYSEGDIHSPGNYGSNFGDQVTVYSSFEDLKLHDLKIKCKAEEREEKINRYRRKKTTRNFGRKIKYACRKKLADSQPRVRGRFAKTQECEAPQLD